MAAKDVRNLILALLILAIGIFFLVRIGKGFTSGLPIGQSVSSFVVSLDAISTLLMMGLGALIIILLPVYLSKHSSEKKLKKYMQQPPQYPRYQQQQNQKQNQQQYAQQQYAQQQYAQQQYQRQLEEQRKKKRR